MKAIVLTCDRYHPFTYHMVKRYNSIWSEHPFEFRVPYQESYRYNTDRLELVKADVNIKKTVITLLEDLDEEEWVFWCIDDKYPIQFSDLGRIMQIYSWVQNIADRTISSVSFHRARMMFSYKHLTGNEIFDYNGNVYIERSDYEQIWLHQFLKVKVLRHMFESFPEEIPFAKAMDDMKHKVIKPEDHRLFVVKDNLAVYGESTSSGKLTKNCYKSFLDNNISVSEFEGKVTRKSVVIGDFKRFPRLRYYYEAVKHRLHMKFPVLRSLIKLNYPDSYCR